MTASFFFYDYETTGIDPKRDRVIQFAGIRTDENFNIIAEPIAEYCQLSDDIIPNLEALLVTGIDYDILVNQGLPEIDFMKIIYKEFSMPKTCVAGYNNIRFDDEFTRYGFYRNFYDPYAREWQNNNSRWDLIDIVRMCAALRPEGIMWPKNPEGNISFKLEDLTKKNKLIHSKAHDALSDVYATIEIAKLVKLAQPKLFDYLLNCRSKHFVNKLIQLDDSVPIAKRLLVHSSRMVSSEYLATSIYLPLMKDPNNPNGTICWDLRHAPDVLLSLNNDVERARYLLYTSSAELKDNEQRLALKTIFSNKVPAVAPLVTVDSSSYDRIKLDREQVLARASRIIENKNKWQKLVESLFQTGPDFVSNDAEHQLYDRFISNNDKKLCTRVHYADVSKFEEIENSFTDSRLKTLFFRYRARNYYNTLNQQEKEQWSAYCHARWLNSDEIASISREEFITKAKQYISDNALNTEDAKVARNISVVKTWLKYLDSISNDIDEADCSKHHA